MVCTRPDISYGVSGINRYMANPGKQHSEGFKWLMRYLAGTSEVGLIFGNNPCRANLIIGYFDSDYSKDLDKNRYITRYGFKVMDGLVRCKAALQDVVVISSTRAEFIALTEVVKEGLWLKR